MHGVLHSVNLRLRWARSNERRTLTKKTKLCHSFTFTFNFTTSFSFLILWQLLSQYPDLFLFKYFAFCRFNSWLGGVEWHHLIEIKIWINFMSCFYPHEQPFYSIRVLIFLSSSWIPVLLYSHVYSAEWQKGWTSSLFFVLHYILFIFFSSSLYSAIVTINLIRLLLGVSIYLHYMLILFMSAGSHITVSSHHTINGETS